MEYIIKLFEFFIKINGKVFAGFDNFLAKMYLPEWISDAVSDSVHMLLFLFLTFLFIEIIESYFSPNIKHFSKFSKYTGPLFGSLLAVFPQCGFSVIAAGLYAKKIITLGTLLAIFISTSDEAIPVLLANPEYISFILPIIGSKVAIAIVSGYLVDFIFKQKVNYNMKTEHNDEVINESVGCCNHNVTHVYAVDLFWHPIVHTANIFIFILLVTIIINAIFNFCPQLLSESNTAYANIVQILQLSLIGLIPNCAASVFITILYAKCTITFAAAVAGLCASSGLGLIVLFKYNKNIADSLLVLILLFCISVLAGFLISLLT